MTDREPVHASLWPSIRQRCPRRDDSSYRAGCGFPFCSCDWPEEAVTSRKSAPYLDERVEEATQ